MTKNFNKLRDNLREEIDHKTLGPMIDAFTSFASDHLGIESLPNINLRAAEDIGTSFGGYNPADNSITLVTKNRHPLDVMRTLAHELVHHRQNEEGRINDVAQEGSDGSDIENEANSRAGIMMRKWGRDNPDHFKMSYVTEEFLNEGINDPGIFKAVFLAGGPGSGKDFILQNIVEGNGLVEINSDNALEFLMKKEGLDLMMPKSEEERRNKARGRAKTITKEKEKLALQGRLGLVINGTADDLEKIAGIKQKLEDLGYDTMMVFVDTTDEVSRQRNFDRGKGGGRKVPDGTDANGVPDGTPNIRLEKWIEAQRNKTEFEKLFGKQSFINMDNSADLRTAPPAVVEQVQKEFLKAFKKVQRFSTERPEKPQAKQWIKAEKERLSMQVYASPKRYTYGQNVKPLRPPVEGTIPGFQMTNAAELAQMQMAAKNAPKSQPAATIDQTTPAQQQALTSIRAPFSSVPASGENDQANAMGLSYYGFGRWGKNINGRNVVTHLSKNGRLVPKQRVMSENVKATYDRMISEIFHMETDRRGPISHAVIKSEEPFKPSIFDNQIFETKTHTYYLSNPDQPATAHYKAVNKKTGKVDMSVMGVLQKNIGQGNQTFTAESLEGRTGSPLKAHRFYKDIMSHPHNGGRATIIQSDWMQLTGGKKTWERLAKSPGVAMHTYAPSEGAKDFNPKTDPEMIWSTGKTEFDPEVNALLQSSPVHQWGTPEMVKLFNKQKEADAIEKKIGPRRLVAFHKPTMDDATQGLNEGEEKVKMSKKGRVKRKLARTLDEDLRKWFKEKWVNLAKPKEGGGYEECGTSGGSSGYAKCVPAAKAGKMTKKQIRSAIRRKRKAQAAAGKPGKNQPGQGNKPIMVKTLEEENKPTNPQLWSKWKQKAKEKFDVYPSAYANAWAAKGYKSEGGGWRSVDEEFKLFAEEHGAGDWGTDELTYNYLNGTPGEENSAKAYKKRIRRKKLTQEAVPLGYEFGNNGIGDEFGVVRSPTGLGFGYSLPMSESAEKGIFDRMGALSGRSVEEEGITLSRYKKKIDRRSDFEQKTFAEAKTPAWQRKEGQDPEGGLNKKGVAAYRRANPGSKLQTAVTTPPSKLKKGSKKAKRRLSFCRRMKGMKAKLTSAETARDPDSRINKALRKWNC